MLNPIYRNDVWDFYHVLYYTLLITIRVRNIL